MKLSESPTFKKVPADSVRYGESISTRGGCIWCAYSDGKLVVVAATAKEFRRRYKQLWDAEGLWLRAIIYKENTRRTIVIPWHPKMLKAKASPSPPFGLFTEKVILLFRKNGVRYQLDHGIAARAPERVCSAQTGPPAPSGQERKP